MCRKNEDANFDFEQHELPKVPRAWERVQKPAFNQNRKGRTVWKRPEIRGTGSYLETSHDSDTISRSVKRQKHMPQRSLRASARNQHQYISTMEDQAPGTPRRMYSPWENALFRLRLMFNLHRREIRQKAEVQAPLVDSGWG